MAVQVPITLSAPGESPVVLAVSTHDRSATAPADYLAVDRQAVVIPAGLTHGTALVYVSPDALDEPTERFVLSVQTAAGATVDDGTASIRITDDDPAPDVTVDDAIVGEGNGTASVAVRLSARTGRDYVRTRGHLTFTPGTTVQTARVPIVDDHIHEETEWFRMQLEEADHGRLADANATIWIGDDD